MTRSTGVAALLQALGSGWPQSIHDLRVDRSADLDLPVVFWGAFSFQIPDAPASGQGWDSSPVAAALRNVLGADLLPRAAELAHHILAGTDTEDPLKLAFGWRLATRVCEAAAKGLQDRQAAGDLVAVDALPRVERARFLLLSFPFREAPGLGRDSQFWMYASRALGTPAELERRAAAARVAWARRLLVYEDHPDLAGLDLEAEAQWLLWRWPEDKDAPLLDLGDTRATAAVATWFGREFMARRFMLRDLLRIPVFSPRADRIAKNTVLASAVLGVVVAVAAPLIGWWWKTLPGPWLGVSLPHWMVLGFAALAYGIIIVGTYRSEGFAYPFALRFGAGVAIGTSLLLTLAPKWATSLGAHARVGIVMAGLLVASFAYLLVEARLQGLSRGGTALARAGGVLFAGLAHGVFVATVTVNVLAPLFLSRWEQIGLSEPYVGLAVLLVATVTVAAGVYLQILWDDRPVTYPLSALRFSRRGSGAPEG